MKKNSPIIKTFIVDNECFFYDAYKNEILHISKNHLYELRELMEVGLTQYALLNKENQEYWDIICLINKGYLKSQFIDEILHPETKYIQDLISRGINDLTLQITRNCNFKCRYCSFTREHKLDRKHERVNMSWQVAKAGIDFLHDHSKDSESISLSFYGGEPLLNYHLIEKAVLYTEQLFQSKIANYYMTFNASLLTQEMIDFFISHNFNLLISLDGPARIQNKHRRFYETGRETFDIVMSNVEKIRKTSSNYFHNYVNFAPVVFEDEKLEDVLGFFESIGINKDKVNYTYANMNGIDYIEKGIYDIKKPKRYYLDDKDKNKIENKFLDKSELPSTWHPYGPCIPGYTKLFLDTYGDFYPCEKIITVPFTKIGNAHDGINLQKVIQQMNIGKLTEEDCKKCWAIRYCEMCIVRCIDMERCSLSKEQKRYNCEVQKSNIENYIANILIAEKHKVK